MMNCLARTLSAATLLGSGGQRYRDLCLCFATVKWGSPAKTYPTRLVAL